MSRIRMCSIAADVRHSSACNRTRRNSSPPAACLPTAGSQSPKRCIGNARAKTFRRAAAPICWPRRASCTNCKTPEVALAVLCPGQGAQHAAMLDAIAGNPAAEEVLAKGARALGVHVREWVATTETLDTNAIAQPLL